MLMRLAINLQPSVLEYLEPGNDESKLSDFMITHTEFLFVRFSTYIVKGGQGR